MNRRGFGSLVIILIVILAIVVIGVVWHYESQNIISTISAPRITSISPTSGPVGTVVTVTGGGLALNTLAIYFGSGELIEGANFNPTSLTFVVPSEIPLCPPIASAVTGCTTPPMQVSTGTYQVSIAWGNSRSNSLPFTVTASLQVDTSTIVSSTAVSDKTPSSSGIPALSSLSPNSIMVTSQLNGPISFKIAGSGFTPTGNTIHFQQDGTNYPPGVVIDATSSDGKSISFSSVDILQVNPNGGAGDGMDYGSADLGEGVYSVSVTNSVGTSNSLKLTATQPSVSILGPMGSFTNGESVPLEWQVKNLPVDQTGWTAVGNILDTSLYQRQVYSFNVPVVDGNNSLNWDTSASSDSLVDSGPYELQICLNPPGMSDYAGICMDGKAFNVIVKTN